jgi:hypothetical protein
MCIYYDINNRIIHALFNPANSGGYGRRVFDVHLFPFSLFASPDSRSCGLSLFNATATALLVPMTTTSRFPREMAV